VHTAGFELREAGRERQLFLEVRDKNIIKKSLKDLTLIGIKTPGGFSGLSEKFPITIKSYR